ncbi:MAG: hypothetical protein WCB97_10730 [Thiobacillus sp.]
MLVIKRLLSSLVIFIPFGVYVYAIQVAYDNTQIKTEPLNKAALFLLALVAGSVTYDFAKHALFMRKRQFEKFFSKLMEAWVAIVVLVIFCIASAVLLHYKDTFPLWLGAAVYAVALGTTAWVVTSATAAIEAATKR